MRPGLSSSPLIPPTLDPVHHAHPVPRTTSQPLAVWWLFGRVHCSSGPRHDHYRLRVTEEVIPLYLKLRCTQLLIRAMTCGSKPSRSSVRWRLRRQAVVSSVAAAGFVGKQTRKPNRIGFKGSCAVSAAQLKEGSKTSPAILVKCSIPAIYCRQVYINREEELYLPETSPGSALQTSLPDPPKRAT